MKGRVHLQNEAQEMAAVLHEEVVAIHDIGSTAVPGIAAKPIIDILVAVRAMERMDDLNKPMIERGCAPKAEFGIAGRRFSAKADEVHGTHHVHVCEVGHPRVRQCLNLRDHMSCIPRRRQRVWSAEGGVGAEISPGHRGVYGL
jgi:GrpB-like predicted nucleotidyltransferase (UPF0157 family)